MLKKSTFFVLCAFALASCSHTPLVKTSSTSSQPKKEAIEEALMLLEEGKPKEANTIINKALALRPNNANLHLLNGLAYQQLANTGGSQYIEMAETGYRLAMEYDNQNWLAAWQLGLLQFQEHKYSEARVSLSKAAKLNPKKPEILRSLSEVAYLDKNVPVALLYAEKTLKFLPADPQALRVASLSNASIGSDFQARQYYAAFQKVALSEQSKENLKERLDDWKEIYDNHDFSEANPKDDFVKDSESAPGPSSHKRDTREVIAPSWFDCPQGLSAQNGADERGQDSRYDRRSSNSISSEVASTSALPSPCKGMPLPRMAVVDIMLIRTEEDNTNNQGVNLLNGLEMVLGGSYDKETTKTTGSANSSTTTIKKSIGLPSAGITYSLNIFNGSNSHADLIARPSLLALDRVPATFFSGNVLTIGLKGNYSSNLEDKPIGVSLAVTPTFIDDDQMLLSVRADRSFVDPNQQKGFQESVSTISNSLTTSVIMRFGETLILSGLRESYTSRKKDGTLGLREIPVVQYLFSNNTETDYSQHVMVVITPRKPASLDELQAKSHAKKLNDPTSAEAVKALKVKHENLEVTLANLENSMFFGEFKDGDLFIEKFPPPRSMKLLLSDFKQLIRY